MAPGCLDCTCLEVNLLSIQELNETFWLTYMNRRRDQTKASFIQLFNQPLFPACVTD